MIQENDIGFDIPSGDFSKIYHNNIIDNENQISVDGDNYWDNGNGQGNYWSDYNGIDNGANGREAGDGVGDTEIPHLGYDHFPLMAPYGQVVILAPLLMAPGKTDDDGSYLLSWISNVDVDGFSLQEDDNEQFISPSIIYSGNNGSIDNYQINGKAEGTYYYRLRAHREGNYSTWSNIVNITVLYPIKPPSNLLAQVWPEGNALNISWDTAGDDTLSYELYLKASGLWSDIPFQPLHGLL